NDLDERIRNHRWDRGARLCEDRGARLCGVAKKRGITFKVAEVWSGDRSLERQLKRQKNSRRFCPMCNAPQYKST
ncbi:MAG: hypothetical protein WCF82_03320, partial [Microcoleus sp.]